jgi:transcriptional regulator with XRE-family HTH domain
MDFHDHVITELRARVAAGQIQQVKVAELLQLPAPRITELLNGGRQLKANEAYKLAELFEMPPLFAGLPDKEDAETILIAVLETLPDDFSQEERASAIWQGLQAGMKLLRRNPDLAHQRPALLAVMRAASEYLQ